MAARKFLGDLIARYTGIGGATADASNPLSVRGQGALFDGNTGGHQVRINKAAAGDTASFLFQNGFSGRAEFGLIGSDDFELKVSDDGSTFRQAWVIDDGTAVTDFKQEPTYLGQGLWHTGDFQISDYMPRVGGTFTGQVVFQSSNYDDHIKLQRNSEDWSITPSTDGSLNIFRSAGTGRAEIELGSNIDIRLGLGTVFTTNVVTSSDVSVGGDLSVSGEIEVSNSNASVLKITEENGVLGENVNASIEFYAGGDVQGRIGFPNTGSGIFYLRNHDGDIFYDTDQASDKHLVRVAGSEKARINQHGLGVNGAAADATNAFSFYGTNLLFNSGSSIDMKYNKNATLDDASLTFQTGFSSKAIMGLLGDDDFSIKVGSSFTEAIRIEENTGVVKTPEGLLSAGGVGSGHITIANNAVGYITPPKTGGICVLMIVDATYPQPAHSGMIAYDIGLSPSLVSIASGSQLTTAGTTTLTGTTGTGTTIAINSSQIAIENRFGSTRTYSYTFIGGEE